MSDGLSLTDALGGDDQPSAGQAQNSPWPGQQSGSGGQPAWPGQPGQPAWPGQPGQPAWTGQPGQPAWPGQPGQPNQPGWPSQPNQPGWPGQPGQPNQPAWSGQPAWPGQPGQQGWPGQPPQPTPPGNPGEQPWSGAPAAPVSGPLSVPYTLELPRGIYDKMLITITGEIKPNPKMITLDFHRDKDIALHINPRFNDHGKKVIVRNSLIGDRWGHEERHIRGNYPFVEGKPFEMKILCTTDEFKIAVNKAHVLEFKYRIRDLHKINKLVIYNDLTLTSVTVDTLT